MAFRRADDPVIGLRVRMLCWGQMADVGRAFVALGLLCALAGPARAELRIEGDETALRIVASQEPVTEILAALKAKFRLRYRPIDLDRHLSGTIAGSLHRVVVRLLEGHDFVVQRSAEGVEIIQIAPRGEAKALRLGRSIAPIWRTSLKQASGPVSR